MAAAADEEKMEREREGLAFYGEKPRKSCCVNQRMIEREGKSAAGSGKTQPDRRGKTQKTGDD